MRALYIPYKGLYRALIPSCPTKNQGVKGFRQKGVSHSTGLRRVARKGAKGSEGVPSAREPHGRSIAQEGLGFRV